MHKQKTQQEKSKSLVDKLNDKISSFLRKLFLSESTATGIRRLLNTLWAIGLSLLIGTVFLSFYNLNPFEYLYILFSKGATGESQSLMLIIIVYGLATAGVSFSFKAGFFNIGVPGQMMLGGISALIIINKLTPVGSSLYKSDFNLILIMIFSGVCGFMLAALAGIFKTFFKIHEVVSTILLNWIVVALGEYFFVNYPLPHPNSTTGSYSIGLRGIFHPANFVVWGMILFILIAIVLFVIMSFTTLGYKIKMNGINKNASEYSGSNQHLLTILSLGFSGFLAGIAGFVYFAVKETKYTVTVLSQPLSQGFNTIPIALIGQNNPIGIIFSTIFYSIMDNGQTFISDEYSSSGVKEGGLDIIFGIIIYTAALSSSFSNFRPINILRRAIALNTQSIYKREKANVKAKIKEYKETYKKNLVVAKENYNKNKPQFAKIKAQIKELDNSVLLKIGKNKNKMNSKEVETLFQNVAKQKLELKQKLDQLGYNEIHDLKNIYQASKIKVLSEFRLKKEEYINEFKYIFWYKYSIFSIQKIKFT
ncbi:sugar ABC transporter permease [Mycoplasmopsis caviae]|uniref:Sugar ABC transporter permease n=1 Tax=Mycoplasmopsis caviae TaxID=55603 RepID=A0ABY5J296_9BACT|nr:sugar ABC transporter permease [Mycoplasmopsis caviae]UUD35132.1 sugar ABC transporter permease [Mycoplasmopsis caviae]